MSNMIKLTQMMLAFVLAGHYAQAAEPKVVTLSCDGTATEQTSLLSKFSAPDPIKMGVVVNFEERTVSFLDYVVPLGKVDAAEVEFGGQQIGDTAGIDMAAGGDIDRVTGHMTARASTRMTDQPTETTRVVVFDVLCKVTNRLF